MKFPCSLDVISVFTRRGEGGRTGRQQYAAPPGWGRGIRFAGRLCGAGYSASAITKGISMAWAWGVPAKVKVADLPSPSASTATISPAFNSP